VQKTTNGTVGVHATKGASLLVCASFVVAEATAQLLQAREGDDVTFVVRPRSARIAADPDVKITRSVVISPPPKPRATSGYLCAPDHASSRPDRGGAHSCSSLTSWGVTASWARAGR